MNKMPSVGNSTLNIGLSNNTFSSDSLNVADQLIPAPLKSLLFTSNSVLASSLDLSSAKVTGANILNYLYGQDKPANNIMEGLGGKLSSREYQQLSYRFIELAQDVGLKAYKRDSLIPGDGIYVDIPATELGGRMLARVLLRFDQVDDKTGGGHATQRMIQPLLNAMGLDKNTNFMKGFASEAEALKLPWYIKALSVTHALLGMVPKSARGLNRGSFRGSVRLGAGRPIAGNPSKAGNLLPNKNRVNVETNANNNLSVGNLSNTKPDFASRNSAAKVVHPAGKLTVIPKPVQIYKSNEKINIRLQGTAPLTEAAKTDAVQNLISYYSHPSTVSALAAAVQRRLNNSKAAHGENSNTLGSFARMTIAEKAALEYYFETGAFEVNGSINSPRSFAKQGSPYGQSDGTYIRSAGQYGHVLKQALEKAPQINGTFVRGANYTKTQVSQMKVGEVIEFAGFSSAAASTNKAFPRNCVLRMFGTASDLRRLNPNEDEVVFPANSRFEVVSKRAGKNSSGQPATIIDLRQIK